MPERLAELKPYKSLVLLDVDDGVRLGPLVGLLLDEVRHLVEGLGDRTVATQEPARPSGGLTVGFLHFVESRAAAWTEDPGTVDQINHLALVCRRGRLIGFYTSDPKLKSTLTRLVGGTAGALSQCHKIATGRLNAAYVAGTTRTLWLSGIHRRVSAKADSKILAGIDLRDSLDPLVDQSYYFSAARSVPAGLALPVGTAPRKSSIWAGSSENWHDFRDTVVQLLERLTGTTTANDSPLPTLALPAADAGPVEGAFDVSFQPPEVLSDPTTADATRKSAEWWAYRTSFTVTEPGPPIEATVTHDGKLLGDVVISPDLSDPQHVRCKVTGDRDADVDEELFAELLRHCRSPRWIKIRFDSGHTLSDGALYRMRFRDARFDGFEHVDLSGYEVKMEKPDPIGAVGTGQSSLFDWTHAHWPNLDGTKKLKGGWLACDDGSMEIADFIHLDERTSPPTLSLIHVKGAGNDSPDRGISVSSYEIVTGQAVKNLRYLDNLLLSAGLEDGLGKKISDLVWKDRSKSNRANMVARLAAIGTNYRTRVVVLQPHVTRASLADARADPDSPNGQRLRQLDALLLGAEATCHGLGAEFLVVTAEK